MRNGLSRSRYRRHRARRIHTPLRYSLGWGGMRRRRRYGWNNSYVYCVGTFGRRRRYGRAGFGGAGHGEAKEADPQMYTCFVTIQFSPEAKVVTLQEIQPNLEHKSGGGGGGGVQLYEVDIPQGLVPGATFQTMLNGQMMEVTIPMEMGPAGMILPPGSKMRIQGPSGTNSALTRVSLTVPVGMGPGMPMQFLTPTGNTLEVNIPQGVTEGQTFECDIPTQIFEQKALDESHAIEDKPEEQQGLKTAGPRVTDTAFGTDENGIRATVPADITIAEFLQALEQSELVQLSGETVLDLTSLHVGTNSFSEEDNRRLDSIMKNGQRGQVEGYIVQPPPAECCQVI